MCVCVCVGRVDVCRKWIASIIINKTASLNISLYKSRISLIIIIDLQEKS